MLCVHSVSERINVVCMWHPHASLFSSPFSPTLTISHFRSHSPHVAPSFSSLDVAISDSAPSSSVPIRVTHSLGPDTFPPFVSPSTAASKRSSQVPSVRKALFYHILAVLLTLLLALVFLYRMATALSSAIVLIEDGSHASPSSFEVTEVDICSFPMLSAWVWTEIGEWFGVVLLLLIGTSG